MDDGRVYFGKDFIANAELVHFPRDKIFDSENISSAFQFMDIIWDLHHV